MQFLTSFGIFALASIVAATPVEQYVPPTVTPPLAPKSGFYNIMGKCPETGVTLTLGVHPTTGCITCEEKPVEPICLSVPPTPAPATCKKSPISNEKPPSTPAPILTIYEGTDKQLTTKPKDQTSKPVTCGQGPEKKVVMQRPVATKPSHCCRCPGGPDGKHRVHLYDDEKDIPKECSKLDLTYDKEL